MYKLVNLTCVLVIIDVSLQAQNAYSIPPCGHNQNKSMWASTVQIPSDALIYLQIIMRLKTIIIPPFLYIKNIELQRTRNKLKVMWL